MSVMSIDGKIVAERLNSLRKARGESRLAVSNAVGVSYITLQRYENTSARYDGKDNTKTINTIKKLAEYYGVSTDYICGFEVNAPKIKDSSKPPTEFNMPEKGFQRVVYSGKRLRFLRKRNRLSAEQVGKAIGISGAIVQRYEKGVLKLPQRLPEFAKFYNVSLDYILGRAELKEDEGWVDGAFETVRHKWTVKYPLNERDKIIILRRLCYDNTFEEISRDMNTTRQAVQGAFGVGMTHLFNEMSDEDLSKILTIIKPYLKEAN